MKSFTKGDNKITSLAMAYKLDLDTGWDVPPGVLHAPGSLCTYEPQFASDVYAMYQSVLLNGQIVGEDLLWKNTPEEEIGNYEYLLDVIDWDKNVDPHYRKHIFRRPIVETETEQYVQKWITYANPYIAAKELTVYPGQTVTIKDGAAYGCIFVQGHGKFGVYDAEAPTLLHFGQQSSDEFFVSEQASEKGITITNTSKVEPLVVLKHFGSNCPGVPQEVPEN